MARISNGWSLIAHGGAKEIAPAEELANREGLRDAVQIGSTILAEGGSALDAVEATVKSLEDCSAYNAGFFGCVRNEDGQIELDASIMDGATLDIGAVAGLSDVQYPVSAARALLRDKTIFLIGEGATRFAHAQGLKSTNTPKPASAKGSDTVGCVARDRQGNLAVATSTGGLECKRVGRVGDVPLPGCGFYADNARGAISASGIGETIARVLLAGNFLHLLETHSAEDAVQHAIATLQPVQGEAGIIAITARGEIVWDHNSPHFAVAMASEDQELAVFLKKREDHA